MKIWTTVLGLATCVLFGVKDASAQSSVAAGWDAAVQPMGATLRVRRHRARLRSHGVETAQRWYHRDGRLTGDEIVVAPGGGTSREVRGVLGTGTKLYVAKHAFLKTDARVNVGGHRSGHGSLRLGVGFDF